MKWSDEKINAHIEYVKTEEIFIQKFNKEIERLEADILRKRDLVERIEKGVLKMKGELYEQGVIL
jgi:hypothetical protein